MRGFTMEKDIVVTFGGRKKRKSRFFKETKFRLRRLLRKIRLRFQMLIWDLE